MGMRVPLLLLAASLLATLGSASSPLVVELKDGKVRGRVAKNGKHLIFRGIPYAKPPLGDLRWRSPEAPTPWKPATLDATEFKPNCLQTMGWNKGWPSIKGKVSEDCLYVDVYLPRHRGPSSNATAGNSPSSPGLPVLVWIHGGDYQYGGSDDQENGAKADQGGLRSPGIGDVIVVTLNYRLGVFGYLGSDDLRNRTADGSTGNYGTQDQRAAIRWAKDNIARFGGDPGRITIFGESAGAGSVTTQLCTPNSFGLYRGAITESGGFATWDTKPMKHAQDVYAAVLGATGCGTVDCLVGYDAKKLLGLTQYYAQPPLPWGDTAMASQWAPVVDGVELTAAPEQLAARGGCVPSEVAPFVMFGTNRNEGTDFVSDNNYSYHRGHTYNGASLPRDLSRGQFLEWSMGTFGPIVGRMVPALYNQSCHRLPSEESLCAEQTFATYWWAAARATGDPMMTCPARDAAKWMTASGHSAFLYLYAHAPTYSVNQNSIDAWGAFHGSEVPFVWGDSFEETGPGESKLSVSMGEFWRNFAATGDPNKFHDDDDAGGGGGGVAGAAKWPPWTPKAMTNIRFDVGAWPDFRKMAVTAQDNLRGAACDFWALIQSKVINPIPPPVTDVSDVTLAAKNGSSSNSSSNTKKAADNAVTTPRPQGKPADGRWTAAVSPLPTGRAGMAVAVADGKIFVVGGVVPSKGDGSQDKAVWHDVGVVEVLDTAEDNDPARPARWRRVGDMPTPRSFAAAAAVAATTASRSSGSSTAGAKVATRQTTIFVLGGSRGEGLGSSVDVVEEYDPEADTWRTRHPMPAAVSGASAASVIESTSFSSSPSSSSSPPPPSPKQLIFVLGGDVLDARSAGLSVWCFDPSAGDDAPMGGWSARAPMVSPRSSMAAAVSGGLVYAMGGMRGWAHTTRHDAAPVQLAEVYDPSTDRWLDPAQAAPPMIHGAHSAAAAAVAIGGSGVRGSNGDNNNNSTGTGSPNNPNSPNSLRSGIVVVGGYGLRGEIPDAQLYDTSARQWRQLPPIPTPRQMLGAVAVGSRLYAIGGVSLNGARAMDHGGGGHGPPPPPPPAPAGGGPAPAGNPMRAVEILCLDPSDHRCSR